MLRLTLATLVSKGRVHAPWRDPARSNGSTRLSDCVCGTNWRQGSELQFLGDVGGFGVGSDFTWQLFGGYSFDFAVWQTTLHGLVGYRALAVDYTQDGPSKNNLDLILHGPVVGLSFRW